MASLSKRSSAAGARTRRSAILLITVALGIAFAATARAADEPPEPNASAVFQYTELVPTASGPKAPGIGESTVTPLPEGVENTLGVSSDAAGRVLAELATSSAYGAPSASATTEPGGAPQDTGSPLGETLGAAVGVGDERLIGLLVVMLASVVAAATLAIATRRVRAGKSTQM